MISVSELRQSTNTDDDGHISYAYYPHVEYSYSILGQSYTSKQIAFGGVRGFNNPNQAQTALVKYPVNTRFWYSTIPKTPLKPYWSV